MSNAILPGDVLVQRDGRVWAMPGRTRLGSVSFEGRGATPRRGWRFECNDCSAFNGEVRRTRRECVLDLIDHWNEGGGV